VNVILALDVGEERIGVALGRPDLALALPKCVLARQGRDRDIQALKTIALEEEACLWVVGLPRQADDRLSLMAKKILAFAARLGRASCLPVAFVDEWETTREATEFLLAADLSRKRRRRAVDKLAAALIMERYFRSGPLAEDLWASNAGV
jgi:putative Holliday junction resolvase